MKMTIFALTALLLVSIASCKKEDHTTSAALTASKTTAIKKGEPVLFTMSTSSSSVDWRVTPAASAHINATGATASIMFSSGGRYVVTASSGNATDSSFVNVTDSVYTPPPAATLLPFLDSEEIHITATKHDSASYSGLIFYAETANTYTCLTNYLGASLTPYDNSYYLNFYGVSVPANCTSGSAKAGSFEYMIPLPDGIYSLVVTFNGTIYDGTIVKTGSNYVINWSYTSGVTISPSTL
jgi:hypothetical protein